ncbi:MBL fold metallo-hydrolase [Bdellovibrionota bacterium FG-1]
MKSVFFWKVILTLAFSTPAFAVGRTSISTLDGCAQLTLARRSTSEACWASKKIGDRSLCLSRTAWNSWLENSSALCGSWQGTWKTYSPPLNSRSPHAGPKKWFSIFYVKELPRAHGTSAQASRLENLFKTIERVRERAHTLVAAVDSTGILSELLTGTRRRGGTLDLLFELGFVHVLTASGIHLYALSRFWNLILQNLARVAGMPIGLALGGSRVITAVGWFLTWLLAGARPGMTRPWLVIVLNKGAILGGLRWKKGAPLVLALGLDLIVGAYRGDLWDGDLSHSGRFAYALACAGGLMGSTHLSMAVGSWVFAALWQGWTSGLMTVATPIISLISIPILAGGVFPLAQIAIVLNECGWNFLAQPLMGFAGHALTLTTVSGVSLLLPFPILWVIPKQALLWGMALAALTLTLKRKFFWIATLLILVARPGLDYLLRDFQKKAEENTVLFQTVMVQQVEQLDVGQGDAALLHLMPPTPQIGLIDSGSNQALTDIAWIQLLAQREIRQIDWIALTHLDEDHCGGVLRLASLIPIGCVATSSQELSSERGQRYQAELNKMGVRITDWSAHCVPLPVLPPPNVMPPSPHAKQEANGQMSAIFVPLGQGGFYLSAGDATTKDEPRIGKWATELAKNLAPGPRILKISHHGSKTSSNPDFLKMILPTEAWISVGAGNRYGHPSIQTLDELANEQIPVHRTDQQGGLREADAHHPRQIHRP